MESSNASLFFDIALTKMHRPRVGHRLVVRNRLLEQLNSSQTLTLVIAPAGSGKTTLLSKWLETSDYPYSWLSLDAHDNDLGLFAALLVKSLRTLFPEVERTLAMVSGLSVPSPRTIAHSLLNDLGEVEQDFILVLDDFHVVHDSAIHELIAELLLHPLPTMRLIIAGRYDPALPLAALRARGDVIELRRADLWFTIEESRHFLVNSMLLELDETTISELTASLQGWPVGLRLTAMLLRQQSGRALAREIHPDYRYLMDYLAEEVLANLPNFIQEFLVKSSILDRLCGSLCAAVLEMPEKMASGQTVLEWLDRSELFVTPIDSEQHWYICHQLFREFLQGRLERTYDKTEISELHLRASAWYAANNEIDEALRHAVASGEIASAVHLVEQYRHEVMNRGAWQQARRWLNLFPREVVDAHPELLLLEVWMAFLKYEVGQVQLILDKVESQLPGIAPERADRLQGEVFARRAALYFIGGNFAGCIATAQKSLALLPFTDNYVREFASMYLSVALVANGELQQAHAGLSGTNSTGYDQNSQRNISATACFAYWLSGDLAGMLKSALRVVNSSDGTDLSELTTWSRYHAGLSYYQRNELIAARAYLWPLALHPHSASLSCFLNSAIIVARILQAEGRSNEALEVADSIESYGLEVKSEWTLFNAHAFQAELALRQGRDSAAVRWADQCGPFRGRPLPHLFIHSEVQALILLAQDTPSSRKTARDLIDQMNDYYSTVKFVPFKIRALGLQAMLLSAEGESSRALEVLADAIALAAPGGFLRLFVDQGRGLYPLLEELGPQSTSQAYIDEILAAFDADERRLADRTSRTSAVATTASESGSLTNRELDVLHLLAKRYSDKEIAANLVISPKTVGTHIEHLSDKLGVHGRRAIVEAAMSQGILN